MKSSKQAASIKRDADPAPMLSAIEELESAGYRIHRPSAYQLKFSEFNFWPSTGKITTDPGIPYPERGIEAFLALIRKRYGIAL